MSNHEGFNENSGDFGDYFDDDLGDFKFDDDNLFGNSFADDDSVLSEIEKFNQSNIMDNNYKSSNNGFKIAEQSEDFESENKEETDEEFIKQRKKSTIVIAAISIVILILAFLVPNVYNSIKAGLDNKPSEQIVKEEPVKNTDNVAVVTESSVKTEDPGKKLENNSGIIKNEKDDWIQISFTSADFSESIEGAFTVTDIKFYTKVNEVSGEKQVKAMAVGAISGLTGTYEVELPYTQAGKLKAGDSFKVTYKVAELNGSEIVGDIRY